MIDLKLHPERVAKVERHLDIEISVIVYRFKLRESPNVRSQAAHWAMRVARQSEYFAHDYPDLHFNVV